MYTILTTTAGPPHGCMNVGDKLIEKRTKELVSAEKGVSDFLTFFRGEPLDPHLDAINATRAVLMPGFPVRDTPMYPGTYRLTDDLEQIRVPLIPIGANWNVYPGDQASRRRVRYSGPTVEFLKRVAAGVEDVSCREYYACDVLEKHGICNTRMTGDPAWFDLSSIGKPMHRPNEVRRLVFSPPLSPYYLSQAQDVMRTLTDLFPDAKLYCAFHLLDAGSATRSSKHVSSAAMSADVAAKNRDIRTLAGELGFDVIQLAGDAENLDFYAGCDLHVGYECHAHLNFFSRRIPSVLIAEDARGVGFNYTLGVGGLTGFVRAQAERASVRKTITSGYCTTQEELASAPPKNNLSEELETFLTHELESGFRRYAGLASCLDETYEQRMRPFIRSLP